MVTRRSLDGTLRVVLRKTRPVLSMNRILAPLLAAAMVCVLPDGASAQTLSNGDQSTFGLEQALRHMARLDLLPLYRDNSEVAQISSYDTTGGNNDGFGGLYSFIRKEGSHLVIADLEGPGVVERIWTPTPTDDTLAFYFDGESTARLRLPFSDLFSGNVFPFELPIAGHEVGGYFSYLPLPYQRSLKIVFEGERIMFHQIQYRRFLDGRAVRSFEPDLSEDERPALDRAISLWEMTGSRPPIGRLAPAAEVSESTRIYSVDPGSTLSLYRANQGGRIVGIELLPLPGSEIPLANSILQARWDDDAVPAILSPVSDFFGYGGHGPSMQSLLAGVTDWLHYCYLPMPFDRSAHLQLTAPSDIAGPIRMEVRILSTRLPRSPESEGRLYTQWRREIEPEIGRPYLLLEAEGRGHHVGTILRAQGLNPGMTVYFEGDDVTTIDGEMRLHGTGSEDYFNGGWYALLDRWDQGVSLPVHGALEYSLPMARTGGYRFYLADKVSFDRSYHLTIEHGPEGNRVPVDYTSLAFYYGERPPLDRIDPLDYPDPPAAPTRHEFYPQLMEVSLGWGTLLDFSNSRDFVMSSEGEGLLRIDLPDVPFGRYRVLLSYYSMPEGAAFSLWQRQKRISPWTSTASAAEELLEFMPMGHLDVTDQVSTLTIRTRPESSKRRFKFNRLVLERLEP